MSARDDTSSTATPAADSLALLHARVATLLDNERVFSDPPRTRALADAYAARAEAFIACEAWQWASLDGLYAAQLDATRLKPKWETHERALANNARPHEWCPGLMREWDYGEQDDARDDPMEGIGNGNDDRTERESRPSVAGYRVRARQAFAPLELIGLFEALIDYEFELDRAAFMARYEDWLREHEFIVHHASSCCWAENGSEQLRSEGRNLAGDLPPCQCPSDAALMRASLAELCPRDPAATLIDKVRRNNMGHHLLRRASYMNHSCAPSAVLMVLDRSTIVLVAKRAIAPGEEVTISYLGVADYEERQATCERNYGFTCRCVLCASGLPNPETCVACGAARSETEYATDRKVLWSEAVCGEACWRAVAGHHRRTLRAIERWAHGGVAERAAAFVDDRTHWDAE